MSDFVAVIGGNVPGDRASAAAHACTSRGSAAADALQARDDRLGAGAARARVRGDLVAEREQTRDARGDAARHHLLDCRAAEPAQLAAVGERYDPLADRVHAADPRAEDGAGGPV